MTTPVSESPDAFQAQLVEAGAAPTVPDVAELLALIQRTQERVNQLEAERGIPSDPVAAAVMNFKAHVEAHAAQNPVHDFSQLTDAVSNLSDPPLVSEVEVLRTLAAKHARRLTSLDLAYVQELVDDLHVVVLQAK